MIEKQAWSSLAERLPLSLRAAAATEGVREFIREAEGASKALDSGLTTALPASWAELAKESLSSEAGFAFAWASSSTLIAAARADVAEGRFMAIAEQQAHARGATLPAAIYSAPSGSTGPYWTDYRSWFELAPAIDAGDLRMVAFCNPALAAQAVVASAPNDLSFAYDDGRHLLEVRYHGHCLETDAHIVPFVGLMKGFLPEQSFAAVIAESSARLRRLHALSRKMWEPRSVEGVRFQGEIPALLIGDRVILDPLAGDFITTGVEDVAHEEELARAVRGRFTTPCTCREQRRVQPVLRPREEVYSFRSGEEEPSPLFRPVGARHCLIWELACSHTSYRPHEAEWRQAGWTPERCEAEWLRQPVKGELAVAKTSGWLSQAAVAHGYEAGALASAPSLVSSLARLAGFNTGTHVTVYTPRANVIFLTDEAIRDEETLRQALETGMLAQLLEAEALPLGADVGFLADVRIEDSAPLELPVRKLILRPMRVGGR